MAAVTECFSIGSIVACTTCFNQEIVGEVMAFDQQTKMLILKCDTTEDSKLKDVYFVNLDFCSNVHVQVEAQLPPDMPPSLNLQRLSTRVRNKVEEKKRLVSALTAGVSPEGQQLYLAITKLVDQVTWEGPNIVINQDVFITPPYTVDNVIGKPGSRERQITYIKKLVERSTRKENSASPPLTATNNVGKKSF
ncbi:LSM12 homolog A-like [Culicoides brevitarsis]|uniref:LSM12 homolog A-like n=1 Tax=Culicoides brevitarsis TaxID=469753 RepID=UPI00307B4E7F